MPEDRKSSWLSKIRARDAAAKAVSDPPVPQADRQRVVFEQGGEPVTAVPGDVWVESQAVPERTVFVQAAPPLNSVAGDIWITQ